MRYFARVLSSSAIIAVLGCANDATGPRVRSGRIVFQSDRTGDFEIFSMGPAGNDVVNMTAAPGDDIHPAWSPDGARVAYVSGSDLAIANPDGSNRQVVVRDAAFPAWSPDGMRLVFRRASGLWIIATNGSSLRQLTSLQETEDTPSWSPDGRLIAFSVLSGAIAAVAVDGTRLPDLVPGDSATQNGAPSWSPDGSMLAFHRLTDGFSVNAPQRIYVVRADGTGLRQVSRFAAGQDWTPAWSPDGTQLVFAHEIGGEFDIYVVNADGSAQRQVTFTGGIQFRPSW
jgi:TolB protein